MATKTKPRSPFQAPDDTEGRDGLFHLHGSSPSTFAGEEKSKYLTRSYAIFMNAERTIAVVSNYSSYEILVKTSLAIEDVVTEDSDILTSDQDYYVNARANGVWYPIPAYDLKSKVKARAAAEVLLKGVQDVNDPLRVEIDGKFGPAFTIAMAGLDTEREYRLDDARRTALRPIAEEMGVDVRLLALAVKEDRLIWATPPVAPKQVMVVVREDDTANLTERLVDEIVLATGQVEGLGKIVEEGSVSTYLLRMRTFAQKQAIRDVVTAREKVTEALQSIQSRAESLLAGVAKGEVVGRGFHDTLRIADEAEKAQKAATQYATVVEYAGTVLPYEFLQSLLKDEFADPDRSFRYSTETVRRSIKALAEINGMEIDRRYDY